MPVYFNISENFELTQRGITCSFVSLVGLFLETFLIIFQEVPLVALFVYRKCLSTELNLNGNISAFACELAHKFCKLACMHIILDKSYGEMY
jgi:hypothetical protein